MKNAIRYDAATCKLGRIVVARLRPGTDLIEGVEKITKDYNIKNAVVCVSIGSLQSSTFMYVVPKPEHKLKAAYAPPTDIEGAVELLAAIGLVSETREGESLSHFHGTVCDKEGKIHGGHLVKGKNQALYTIELVILEVKNVSLTRKFDEEVDAPSLFPEVN